jgi:hypothetical protein
VPRIEEQIEIAAKQADVFRFCHDGGRRAEWDEQVKGVELLTPPPIRQGTLLRVDAALAGSVFTWDGEVTGFQFPASSRVRVIDAASSSPFGQGSQLTWQLSASGNSTRFTWIWEYEPRGFIARIKDSLGGRAATQRAIKSSLNNLKAIMEGSRRTHAR